MTEVAERLKAELSRLPQAERAELAHYLIETLDATEDSDAEATWDAELTRRIEEIRSGVEEGEDADEVIRELRRKYS